MPLMKMKLISESIEDRNPTDASDLPTRIHTGSPMVNAMTKLRTKNEQWLGSPVIDYS
jgi:hypothetical protein